jgi:hypothetical protein
LVDTDGIFLQQAGGKAGMITVHIKNSPSLKLFYNAPTICELPLVLFNQSLGFRLKKPAQENVNPIASAIANNKGFHL